MEPAVQGGVNPKTLDRELRTKYIVPSYYFIEGNASIALASAVIRSRSNW
jgi:hypothetical protein